MSKPIGLNPHIYFDLSKREAAAAIARIKEEETQLRRRKAKAIGQLDWNSALAAIQIAGGDCPLVKELSGTIADFGVNLSRIVSPPRITALDASDLEAVERRLAALADAVGNAIAIARIAGGG